MELSGATFWLEMTTVKFAFLFERAQSAHSDTSMGSLFLTDDRSCFSAQGMSACRSRASVAEVGLLHSVERSLAPTSARGQTDVKLSASGVAGRLVQL